MVMGVGTARGGDDGGGVFWLFPYLKREQTIYLQNV